MFLFGKAFTDNVHFKAKDIYVDNMVFRLHYRLTFWFLMVCTAIVCTRQYIGDHINCIADKGLEHVINTYCFFMTTYTVVEHHDYARVRGGFAAHPGVGPDLPGAEVKRHSYYQWVPFVFFTQALFFYLPHYFWKKQERGRVKAMVDGMKKCWLTSLKDDDVEIKGYKIQSGKSKEKNVNKLRDNILMVHRFGVNRDWARYLVLAELMNVVNVVVQIYLADLFLGGRFRNLGPEWLAADSKSEFLDRIFPKVTKCTFSKYGPTGTIQKQDAMCVMALNIINEKIYVMLWFWLTGLLVVTCLGALWRAATYFLHSRSPALNRLVWGQACPGPPLDPSDVRTLTRAFCFADWLFLYYVGKNIDGTLFRSLVQRLADGLRTIAPSPTPSTSSADSYPSLYPNLKTDSPEAKLINIDYIDGKSNGESSC